jgi:acyl dehydratase
MQPSLTGYRSRAAEQPEQPVAPYFEDLTVGHIERGAPAVTLTDGMAAVHQAIVGDRLALALDTRLARAVLGAPAVLAHPALVWDVAIGQSTLLTGRVIANLFYRGLLLQQMPVIGDTLSTSVEVVALRQTTTRPGRPASGLAALRVRTSDQAGRAVLDFWRCAMLRLRDPDGRTENEDSFEQIPQELDARALRETSAGWRLDAFVDSRGGERERLSRSAPGARWAIDGGDVVSAAPELARLSLNVAAVHHDRHSHREGRRLVYGGHTIGLAAAQASRLLPEIATIVGWHSCEHLAPVHEGDTLYSELELERCEPLAGGGALAHLRSRVIAIGEEAEGGGEAGAAGEDDDVAGEDGGRPVLDWRFVAVVA